MYLDHTHFDTLTLSDCTECVINKSKRPASYVRYYPTVENPVVFEPAIPTTKKPQTYALDRAACEITYASFTCLYNWQPSGWLDTSESTVHSD